MPWNARGENLAAHISWDGNGHKYLGTVALDPLRIFSASLKLAATASLERDRIVVGAATIASGDSEVNVTHAEIGPFTAPVVTAEYKARVSCRTALVSCPAGLAGSLNLAGRARYASAAEYNSVGSFHGAGDYRKLQNAHLSGVFDARPGVIALHSIRADGLGGAITAEATLRDFDSYTVHGRLEHFDLRQTAALGTKKPLPYDGQVSGPFDVVGRVANLAAGRADIDAHLQIAPAGQGPAARGEIAVHYDSSGSIIELGNSWLELPQSRIELSGILGASLKVNARSTDMKDLLPALELTLDTPLPAIGFDAASFEGTVTGPLAGPRISGHAAARKLDVEGHLFDSLEGQIALTADTASVRSGLVSFGDVRAQVAGSVALHNWKTSPTSTVTASVEVRDADMTKILAMAGQKALQVTGTLSGSGQINGTLASPLADADVTLSRGTIYRQPFDSISGRLQIADPKTQSLTGLFVSGPKRVNISARFAQAPVAQGNVADFPAGTLEFNLTSNTMPLNQIALVRARQPDIHGFGKFHADGAIGIGHDAKREIDFRLLTLNADASANSLELEGRNLGDARFTAQSKDGVMQTQFDSNAAKAVIHGEGTVKLDGDYPLNVHVTFANAGLNAVAALIVKEEDAAKLNFDGEAQGEVTLTGPATKLDQWAATLDVSRLELRPLPGGDFARSNPQFAFTNQGPLRVSLANSRLRIESVHFKAPQTDLTVDGTVALTGDAPPLNLRVNGDVNLLLARTFNKDLTSSGALTLNATVRGTWGAPDISGRASLRNGEFRYADFVNGLSNASGDIVFNGTRATIQSFTAETGGGKVELAGFAALAGGSATFRVEARAQQIRVRYPEGVSSVSDAALTFFGNDRRSEVSGSVTVRRVSINPREDTASILEATAAPLQAPAAQTGLTSRMNLDIRIQTAPDVALQTSVAQSLEADASLTLRGTVANPALLGRINITQGEMVFFGNKYAINQGSISFFNPARIDPILNIDLETKARGVDVTLTVAGPMTKLNVSYRSDPPLQFSDIIALLATGRAPGDPTLAVQDTGQAQGFQQLGASTLLGEALANPVAGRLQRFFGVSRVKIDPQLTGVTGSPEARLTIEQQINPEILLTYITDVSSTSTQLIRAEWSFNRHWSAILIREEDGFVGLDFVYKKRFK
jgi:translocation and assembly module TamB